MDPGIRTILSIVKTMGINIEDLQGIPEKNMNTDKPTGAGDGADMIIEELSAEIIILFSPHNSIYGENFVRTASVRSKTDI